MPKDVEDDCEESVAPATLVIESPSYALDVGLYFTNARSSFCRDTPVNCATTIERKPDALLPSAHIPFIP